MNLRPYYQGILLYTVQSILGSCVLWEHPTATTSPDSPPIQEEPNNTEPSINVITPDTNEWDSLVNLATNDPELALYKIDKIISEEKANSDIWLLFGQAALNLFNQRLAEQKLGPSLASDLFNDAELGFKEAMRNEENLRAAHLGLLQTYTLQGKATEAWDIALNLHELWEEKYDSLTEEEETLFATAGLNRVIAIYQNNASPLQAEHLAIEAFERLLSKAQNKSDVSVKLADLHTWRGRTEAALIILNNALLSDPNNITLYQRLNNLGSQNRNLHVATLKQLTNELPGEATPLWYYGEALYYQAYETRIAADFIKAMNSLDEAERVFEQASQLNKNYQNSCQEWITLTQLQRVWTLRSEGRLNDACSALLVIAKRHTNLLEELPEGENLANAISYIVYDFVKQENLRSATSFLTSICQIKDANAAWLNNLGFFNRELGVEALEAGNSLDAKRYFDDSYAAYSRCVELAPEDVRYTNDRALIAAYYLDQDTLNFAEEELLRAVQLGEKQLKKLRLNEDTTKSEIEQLDEAVGDAYENLAYITVIRRKQTTNAAQLLKMSRKHFPFEERSGVKMIEKQLEELLNK